MYDMHSIGHFNFTLSYINITGATIYYISHLVNTDADQYHDDYEINIIDGQNETQIEQYIHENNTNNWDPCLPKRFNTNPSSITITFDTNNINDLNDWYPMSICYNNSNKYKNEYLFDGGNSLIINDLMVNNFVISSRSNNDYSLIRTFDSVNASIHCINCKFIHIFNYDTKPLLDIMGSVYLFHSEFFNVSVSANLICGQRDPDDRYIASDRLRNFVLENTSFSDIKASSILTIKGSKTDVKFKIVLNFNF